MISNIFKKYQKLLSVDFSPSVISLVYAELYDDEYYLIDFDYKFLSASDQLNETESVIRNFLKKNSLHSPQVFLSIHFSDSIGLKFLDLPELLEEEIMSFAQFEMTDIISFDIKDSLIDWKPINDKLKTDLSKKQGIIVAAKKEKVDSCLSILEKFDLKPTNITYSMLNYENVLSKAQPANGLVGILDIGYKESTLGIYHKSDLIFSRILSISKEKLILALTESLHSEKKDIVFTYREAENVIYQFGTLFLEESPASDSVYWQHIKKLMRPYLEMIVKQLEMSFNYFVLNNDLEYPVLLYLTGPGSNIKNIDVYLKSQLKVNVVNLDVPKCINLKKLKNQELTEEKTSCILGALAGIFKTDNQINLIKSELKEEKSKNVEKLQVKIFVLLIGLLISFSFIYYNAKVQIKDFKLKFLKAKLHDLQRFDTLARVVSKKEGFIYGFFAKSKKYDDALRLISDIIPDELTLDEAKAEGDILNIKGEVLEGVENPKLIILDFVSNIRGLDLFKEASIDYFNENKSNNKFLISAKIF